MPRSWPFQQRSKDSIPGSGAPALSDFTRSVHTHLLLTVLALPILAIGIGATLRNALETLRVVSGSLLILCLLRHPFLLLLIWASLNTFIGSSLALFNGNHLDMVLLVSTLLLPGFLSWQNILQRVPYLVLFWLYLGWILLGLSRSPLSFQSFMTLWLTMLASGIIVALTIASVRTYQRLLALLDLLLLTALATAFCAFYCFATHQYGEIDSATGLFRVTSIFTQATTFAFYLSLLIPLALYRCWSSTGIRRLSGGCVVLLLLTALALTFTRSAFIGVFLELLILAVAFLRPVVRIWGGTVLALCSALALIAGYRGLLPWMARFFSGDMGTLNGRTYLWQALLAHFQVTQWLGNGLQSSDILLASLHVGFAGHGVIGTAPHSLYLGTLYDHGLVGLLLLLTFFLWLGLHLWRGTRRSSGQQRLLYIVALATLSNMLIQSWLSRDIWIQGAGVAFWIVIALPDAYCWPSSQGILDQPPVPSGVQEFLPLFNTLPVYYLPD